MDLMEGMLVHTSERDHFFYKLKVLAHLLRVKKDPRAISPSPSPFSPNPSDTNFEIATFFK